MKVIRNDYLSMGLIKMNIISAKQAINYFDETGFKTVKNGAAYDLQQACEKMLKIQLYSSGKPLNNRKLYTHNLRLLYDYGCSLGIKFITNKYCLSNMDTITSWEAESRYDLHFSININTLKACLRNVEYWYNTLYNKGYR